MILGPFLTLIALVLLRFFFTCPDSIWNRLGPMARKAVFYSQQVLYWGVLIAGLILTFISSLRIGLVAFGCFLILYNASVSSIRWKAIPLLGNSLVQVIGIALFTVGLVLSFIASRQLGFLALAGSFMAVVVLNISMGIERNLMKKRLTEQETTSNHELNSTSR